MKLSKFRHIRIQLRSVGVNLYEHLYYDKRGETFEDIIMEIVRS